MKVIVPLGCNCHPAWWLRKLQLRTKSMPFDWLLSKPHVGLAYAVEAYADRFRGFFDNIVRNAREHPVSARYPSVEFFHHHDLLSDNPMLRLAEKERLERRAELFCQIAAAGQADFLYCYAINSKHPRMADLQEFEDSVDKALTLWPDSKLHIYFMADSIELLESSFLKPRQRLVEYSYFRDQSIHNNWGSEPGFLSTITDYIETQSQLD